MEPYNWDNTWFPGLCVRARGLNHQSLEMRVPRSSLTSYSLITGHFVFLTSTEGVIILRVNLT